MSRMSTAQNTRESSLPAGGLRGKARVPFFTAEAWAPLRVELFRSLWIATSIAQIGTWVREAAGPSLMETLTHGSAVMVARVLVISNLPICLFSVLAGALADVLDRRRLLIVTQLWMVAVSAVLGLLTMAGWITPGGLLAFIFLLGVGTAAFGPALQALLPELVPKQHFALAINMNSVALNVARAVGPALFIVVVQFVPGPRGAGAAFLLSAASFLAAVWVLWRWRRPPQRAAVHGEQVWNGIYAGWRYTVHSAANRAILLRVLTFIVPAVVMWSQVPIIATKQLNLNLPQEQITAMLFTFVGAGAVLGVFLMPGLHGRYKIDPVVNVCTALFALALIALAFVHVLWLAALILLFLGLNWVIIPTNFNTATQKSVPLWVKGRAISFYLTVLFGSFAIGGSIWGHVTDATGRHPLPWLGGGIHASLLLGGLSMLALLTLAIWFPLTLNEGKDLTAAYSGRPPADALGPEPAAGGPIRVAIRYRVPAHRREAFKGLLNDLRLTRIRNGARRWSLEDGQPADGHVALIERVDYSSWQEYARSYSRTTKWDTMLEGLAKEYHVETEPPQVVAEELQRGFPVSKGAPRARATGMPGDGVPASRPTEPRGATSGHLPAARWSGLEERVGRLLDRGIDELFVAYDRVTVRRPRGQVTLKLMAVRVEDSRPSNPARPAPTDPAKNAPPPSTGPG